MKSEGLSILNGQASLNQRFAIFTAVSSAMVII